MLDNYWKQSTLFILAKIKKNIFVSSSIIFCGKKKSLKPGIILINTENRWGHTSPSDVERSDYPVEVLHQKKLKKFRMLSFADRRLKVRKIVITWTWESDPRRSLSTSKTQSCDNFLDMRQRSPGWVQRSWLLTPHAIVCQL